MVLMNDILDRTKEIIVEQGSLPMSPCVVGDPSERMCGAACLVYAGLELTGSSSEAKKYRDRLLETGDKSIVNSYAEKLTGINLSMVDSVFTRNDSSPTGSMVGVIFARNDSSNKDNRVMAVCDELDRFYVDV